MSGLVAAAKVDQTGIIGAMRNATVARLELFHRRLDAHTASLCHPQFCHMFGRREPSPTLQRLPANRS